MSMFTWKKIRMLSFLMGMISIAMLALVVLDFILQRLVSASSSFFTWLHLLWNIVLIVYSFFLLLKFTSARRQKKRMCWICGLSIAASLLALSGWSLYLDTSYALNHELAAGAASAWPLLYLFSSACLAVSGYIAITCLGTSKKRSRKSQALVSRAES